MWFQKKRDKQNFGLDPNKPSSSEVPRRFYLEAAVAACRACDLMLVVGTSLVVNPAARLPLIAREQGARLAIVNREETKLDHHADVHILGEAGPTLSAMVAGMRPRP